MKAKIGILNSKRSKRMKKLPKQRQILHNKLLSNITTVNTYPATSRKKCNQSEKVGVN